MPGIMSEGSVINPPSGASVGALEEGASNRDYFRNWSISALAVLRSAVSKPSVKRT